eukprot:363443-Chlamydomonas_euryale.AAC.5
MRRHGSLAALRNLAVESCLMPPADQETPRPTIPLPPASCMHTPKIPSREAIALKSHSLQPDSRCCSCKQLPFQPKPPVACPAVEPLE